MASSNTLMIPVKFANKRVLQVKDTVYIGHINKELRNYSIIPTERNYKFLDNNNLNYLKINKHLVSLNGFGKKCILFLTKIKDKSYCFFINKKTGDILYVRYRFKDDIFTGTVLDGEMIKDNDGNWIYSIIDILIYKGNSMDKLSLQDRINEIETMLKHEYIVDNNFDIAKLEVKKYFEYKYMNDLYTKYKDSLNYRCSGFIFKNILCNDKYLLHILEENRTKNKIENIKIEQNNKTEIAFKINKTEYPDIYELHCSKDGNLHKYGYAAVPTLAVSMYLNDIFKNINNEDIYMKCSFHIGFNKWTPYDKTDYLSEYKNIQKIVNENTNN